MFKFFTSKKWFLWAYLGSAIILSSLWIQVQIDVKINEWFGEFYNMIQKALAEPNVVTIEEYFASLWSFITLAIIYVGIAVVVIFFTQHFLFRWRMAMVDWYHSVYDKARTIEGASQRVQEDSIKFTRIMENLGTSFIEAIMIIVEFLPILFGLSVGIPIFFFGDWQYGLVVGALIWSVGGTLFLIVLGLILRLVGVEYDLQKQEAAYRKILVIAEDDGNVRPKTLEELFDDVREIHYLSYIRYFYFNIGRVAYLQLNVMSAYVFLAPAIVAGVITLGALLGTAAHLEGKGASTLDVAGLAQRNGPVTSHLRVSNDPEGIHATRIASGSADLILGCDIVVTTGLESISKINPRSTNVMVNSHVAPTSAFASDPNLDLSSARMKKMLRDVSNDKLLDFIDATKLASSLMGNAISANLFIFF